MPRRRRKPTPPPDPSPLADMDEATEAAFYDLHRRGVVEGDHRALVAFLTRFAAHRGWGLAPGDPGIPDHLFPPRKD